VTTSTTAHYRDTAREFAQRAKARLGDNVHALVLYGSVARDTATEWSDIDVLVLSDENEDSLSDKIQEVTWPGDGDLGKVAVRVYTASHIARLLHGGWPFARRLLQDGIPLCDDGHYAALVSASRELVENWSERMSDPDNEYVRSRLELAEKMLNDATQIRRLGLVESAADRAYYAMFHSAEAALALQGIEPGKTHRGVGEQLRQLTSTGRVNPRYGEQLITFRERRESVTYGGNWVPTEKAIDRMIEVAGLLLSEVRQMAEETRP
jgi:uncharacterized protein (UPF0332 family)/predicted nucleotidyltransferase